MKSSIKKFIISFALLLITNLSFAQTTQIAPAAEPDMSLYYTILVILFFLLLNGIFIPLMRTSEAEETIAAEEKKITVFQKLKDRLSGLQPIESEKDLLLEGDYDGIRELNNNVPPWFNILFYGTIVIGIIYFLNYHVLKIGKLPFQEYSDEVYAAEIQREELIRTGAFINENTVVLLKDSESLKTGKQIFTVNCVTCHGDGGQGTIGPNLTDEYWIHGGGIKNVFSTIKYGVPAKGMITWMNQFNPKMIQQVASYVITLQGTNPPGGKIPEGNKYEEIIVDSAKTVSDSVKTNNSQTESVITDSAKVKK